MCVCVCVCVCVENDWDGLIVWNDLVRCVLVMECDVMWNDMILILHGMNWCDALRCDVMLCDLIWHSVM